MQQKYTLATVGLLIGLSASSSAQELTIPTPDIDARFLHANLSERAPGTEDHAIAKNLRDNIGAAAALANAARKINAIEWSHAGFTNPTGLKAYGEMLFDATYQAATSGTSCFIEFGCRAEEVSENMKSLYREITTTAPALTDAINRVNATLDDLTPHSPLTSASNIDEKYVTDHRTYRMTADDNKELTPRNGVLMPVQTNIPNTLITVPQFTVNYNGSQNDPKISLEGVETVDSMTTDTHEALVTDVGARNEFRLQPGKSSVLAVGNNNTTTGPDALSIGTGNTSENSLVIGTESDGTDQSITIGTKSHAEKQSIAIGSGTTARKGSVAIGNGSETTSENELSIGNAKNGLTRTITNMKDGVADTDGATVHNVREAIKKEANKYTNTEITTLDGKAKGYTSDALKKANEHTERRAVVAENNAVTRSNVYTDESSSRTLDKANTYTNHRAAQAENNAVARSNAYTNKRFGELKNQVNKNEKRANGGIAGAMAMSTITGSGSGFGMALSGYRDQSAIAAGIQKSITPNTTVNVKVAWDSGNGVGAAAGFFTSW